MVSPRRALVRPRVFSPVSGELLLLEDEVRSQIESSPGHGGIAILGPPGSGKTTALAHLAAVLLPLANLRFLDEPDLDQLRLPMTGHLVIFTHAGELSRDLSCSALRLAGWERDDWIEYLLAAHRDRCCSVLSRIQPADRSFLKGNPELWSIVLEAMALDESLPDAGQALLQTVETRVGDAGEVRRLQGACLTALVGPRRKEGHQWLVLEGQADHQRRLFRHAEVQVLMAAKRIAADLSEGTRGEYFSHHWPRSLVEATSSFLVGNDQGREKLERIFERRTDAQAMAASLLHALEPAWRPQTGSSLWLARAYLDHVSWAGICLESSRFFQADLSEANLQEGDLRKADLSNANLSRAILRSAKLTRTTAEKTDFRHADLRGVRAHQACWKEADLSGANCEKADFQETDLQRCNLAGCNFRFAQFKGAKLAGANIEGADFSSANFQGANLTGLCLRATRCTGADFREAILPDCDLESMELPDANFEDAQLSRALLTGTLMPAANFRNANLSDTGLADIEWECADLRGADLRGASFHLGSTRSGLVNSPIASEGTRTGFYTDDFNEQDFKAAEEIRKANLRGADLRGARLDGVDFYLVDLRDALFDPKMEPHFRRSGAILEDRS